MAPQRAADQAADVFADVVAEHVRRIQQRVPAAVTDEPDAVHRLRAAVRRLRTVLSVYRPVFDRAEATALREHLARFGDVLGTARDLEVRRADVESVGRDARVSLDARAHLVSALDTRHAEAHRRLVDWCQGPEWDELSGELVRWVATPPRGKAAGKPARKVARKRLRKAVAKALRAADDVDLTATADVDVDVAPGGVEDEEMARAHRLRKAGRRLTHAARAVTSNPTKVLGSSTRALGEIGKRIQSTLGDHRDMLLLARYADEVGDTVASRGGDRSGYDRLAHAARRRGREALDEAASAVAALREATD
ncbi:CHAD domain-containing protein [Isoptericola jiangsuensis]|uniref:CHAD domain-containing protein n=1 Tax=Isoptericola jiangsuensis TaxID=548579 RepID=UPI003AABBAA2